MAEQQVVKGFGAGVPPQAFHVERVTDPVTGDAVIGMVRHAGHAWRAPLPEAADAAGSVAWQRIGAAYLGDLQRALGLVPGQDGWLHPAVHAALVKTRDDQLHGFGWLDVTWDGPVPTARLPDGIGPLGSFWVQRDNDGDPAQRQRSLVLLAGSVNQRFRLQFGTEIGLRITLHVRDDGVRIHGLTLAGLATDRFRQLLPPNPVGTDLGPLRDRVRHAIGQAIQCEGFVWIGNLERVVPGPDGRLRARGQALRQRRRDKLAQAAPAQRPQRPRVHDFCVDVNVDLASQAVQVVQVHRNHPVGSAATEPGWATWRVFLTDPASQGPAATLRQRRPTRDEPALAACLGEVQLNLAADGGLRFGLQDDGAPAPADPAYRSARQATPAAPALADVTAYFETSAASPGSALSGTVATQPLGGTLVQADAQAPILSDAHGALQTHVRASELFLRILAHGVDPHAMFRFARLPLVQRARPAMRWAPDGELPNAEVRPFAGVLAGGELRAEDRLQLLVLYGSASPFHRRKLPLAGTAQPGRPPRRRAQYLSVASDPRWAWHEFGHVLNYASTGELEFPFAHSAGDALAAIVADPLSRLATGDDPLSPARMATFPWIEVPGRSHGRSAWRGYCWCGRRNLLRTGQHGPVERFHHSYFGEQLMSSSLFRLYRSLGGDSFGDCPLQRLRLEASDYCVYLVMQAISLLGPDSLAPARTADQFVSALVDADLGTGAWDLTAAWPLDQGERRVHRQGGQVHKVVRWAFERQGLYATDRPDETAEGPGRPPEVDVYIADARPLDAADPDPGGYTPVPLRRRADGRPSPDEHWHAHADALVRSGREVRVALCSRGRTAPGPVRLRLWWTADRPGGPLRWEAAGAQVQTVPGKEASALLQLPDTAPASALGLLVAADADADPSNLPPGEAPPSDAAALMALVAHDNNLALAWR